MQVGTVLPLEATKRKLNTDIVQLGTSCQLGDHVFQGTHKISQTIMHLINLSEDSYNSLQSGGSNVT